MSSDYVLSQINHYQKKLKKYIAMGETEKLLGCIHKLKYLPVTVKHLELTGVGKSINALKRKNGDIGEKARVLVEKWKTMVYQEEREDSTKQSPKNTPAANTKPSYSADSPYMENNEDEYDPSDEGDRLHMQETENESPPPCLPYNPGGNANLDEEEEDNSNGYNPHTSREDYVSIAEDPVSSSYNPSSKDYPERASPESSSLLNGNTFPDQVTTKVVTPHKSEDEGKHKKKSKKSKHNQEEKHKSSGSSSSSHHRKSKDKHSKTKDDKENSKEKEKSKSKHKSSHSSSSKGHNSSHLHETVISPAKSTDCDQPVNEKKRRLEEEEEEEEVTTGPSQNHTHHHHHHQESAPKKSKSSRSGSTKQKQHPLKTESSSGFEAALMGMESTSSKKRKKKSKDKEREKKREKVKGENSANELSSSHAVENPPHTSKNVDAAKSTKPKQLNVDYGRERLPPLPSVVEDEYPQLMTHYKPLPQVPQRHAPKDNFSTQMTNEEALNFMLSSRNNKQRRIYTGKTAFLSYVPSLFDICIRVLQENIDALEATGGIPFEILKPVLEKASPQQLFSLENHNPYLLDDTDSLWASHCRKHFKGKQREDLETWRDMFFRCTDEHDEKMRSVTEILQKKYVTKAPPKRTTQLAYVNTAAKPPKSVARAQARYGTMAQVIKPSRSDEAQRGSSSGGHGSGITFNNGGGSSNSCPPPKPDRPFPNRPTAVKKPKVAPLMGKARQLMKKVCRR